MGCPEERTHCASFSAAAEHPPPLLEDSHHRPVRAEAVDVHLGPTDHQVDVDRRDVDPGGEPAAVVE